MNKLLFGLIVALATPVFALSFDPTPTPVSPGGKTATISLPTEMHQRNTGGSDGYGLCVFTSAEMAGWGWQNLEELHGFQKWMEKRPGGGWPDKFDDMLAQFCEEKGVEVPPYIQHVGGDTRFLELCMKTRRAPCITYAGMDDFYNEDIAHMVVLAHFDDTDACILDNNRPGKWLWMTREQQVSRWHLNTAGKGWAYVFLTTPPPPVEDGITPKPTPKPKPKPKPKPWRPLRPRWLKVVLFDGEVLQKLFDGDKFLGVWEKDGWHPAVDGNGWTVKPEGVCPVEPPTERSGRFYTNGGFEVELEDWFTDDSGKPYLTAVVKDKTEKAALLKALAEHPRAKELEKVHLNVFEASWWAAGNVKHNLTVQGAGETKALWFNDVACPTTVFQGLDAAFPKPVAPTPRPVAPKEPESPPDTAGAPESIKPKILVPTWAVLGALVSLAYGVHYVRSH